MIEVLLFSLCAALSLSGVVIAFAVLFRLRGKITISADLEMGPNMRLIEARMAAEKLRLQMMGPELKHWPREDEQ